MMYDVVVIGAGPAGGELGRVLSSKKRRVLVIDRLKNLSQNNFSSAGTVLETLQDYSLPDSVIGSYWNKLTWVSSRQRHTWKSSKPLGVILDFAKLRHFLSDETEKNGGQVLLHHSFQKCEIHGPMLHVYAEDLKNQERKIFKTKILVDATGPSR